MGSEGVGSPFPEFTVQASIATRSDEELASELPMLIASSQAAVFRGSLRAEVATYPRAEEELDSAQDWVDTPMEFPVPGIDVIQSADPDKPEPRSSPHFPSGRRFRSAEAR
jgi:hypothetical protein